jgi:thiol-disulfide isomerase/thioredoxin
MTCSAVRRSGALVLIVSAVLSLTACRRAPLPPANPPPSAPVTSEGTFKAILINGGGRPLINFQSHLTHVRTLVDFLRANGANSSDLTIFSSDGNDPSADLATRADDSLPDAWLLPMPVAHRLRPVQYVDSEVPGFTLRPATTQALQSWFDTDGRKLRSGDTLLLYVTDHGEQNKKDPANNTIVLWHESLSVNQLRDLLAELNPGVRVVMVMSQCFSGSFANALFSPGGDLTTNGNTCGYFASTADRPAYGCYPENRGLDGVGHSHHLFQALNAVGRLPEAEKRVLITDDSPDVPNTTSDFYLQQLLARAAQEAGRQPRELNDELIADAFRNRAQWEPEIRLMDRIGSTFGMFSPRSLAELDQQTTTLPQVSAQLRTYAERWSEALESLKEQNLERFLVAHPRWRARLDPKALDALDQTQRNGLATALLGELRPFTLADPKTYERLQLLKQRADDADAAAYRMEVRLGVVLRMQALLFQIAGREYLAEHGTAQERSTFASLRACEDVTFLAAPEFANAAAMAPPPPFPPLDEDRQVVQAVMPAWMGIQFRPIGTMPSKAGKFPPGAVAVMTVYPDSPAASAGLEVGDLILGPPGHPFNEPQQVREWTMRRQIGESAPLEVVRGDSKRQVSLRPAPFPIQMPELPGPPKVGSAAPPLHVDPFRGDRTFAAGRPHLLFFWATWCAPCKFSLPEVMAFAAARGVEVVAITDEDPETLKGFFAEFKDPFPPTVAIDPYRATFQAYGVSGTPTFVLVDADGVVRHYHTGYNPELGLQIEGWDYRATQQKAQLDGEGAAPSAQ